MDLQEVWRIRQLHSVPRFRQVSREAMSEAVSPAEDAYASGLKIWEISMQAGGAKGMLPDAVKYLREAISLGLEPSKEVVCYLTLGLVLFDLYREQF